MALEAGSLLYNRYRIVAELGRGGMGAVYQARDENLGVEVAIKENLFVSPQFAQQFRREATLLAGLRHPSLPRVTDHFVILGQGQYLVMDFVAGDDAGRRLRQANRPLPERDVLAWAADILDALQYLHSRRPPVVHRDIKPGNIKITPEGRAVLVDFGLAKAQDSAEATATGAKGLSPGYSPPEQYGSGRTDIRSDLYSLGATMYALLAGQKPVDALERALGHATLVPLLQLNPLVSGRTAAAVEGAMAVQPDARFANAAEFLAAFSRDDRTAQQAFQPTVAGRPPVPPKLETSPHLPPVRPAAAPPARPTASPPGAGQPAAPPPADSPPAAAPRPAVTPPPAAAASRPGRGNWLMLGVALLLLMGAGVVTGGGLLAYNLFVARPTLTPTVAAISSTPVPTAIPSQTAAPATVTAPATASATSAPRPTQTPPPTVTPGGTPGQTRTPQTAAPTVTRTAPGATPVGGGLGQIAFVSEHGGPPQIFLMNADGSNVTQLTHGADGACQPAWSPDGKQLLFVAPCSGKRDSYPGSSIFIAGADGSSPRPFITVLGGAYHPAWSVGGIAFVHPVGSRPQIYTAQADGSGARDISSAHADDSQPSWSPDGKRLAFANLSRSGRPTIYWMFADGSFRPGFANPDAVTRDVDAAAPAWSPNGQLVAFVDSSGQILAAPWDKLGFGTISLTSAGPNADPAWSPDSQWIVFESWRDGAQHDIYRMTFSGTEVTRLTNDPAPDYQPAWRP